MNEQDENHLQHIKDYFEGLVDIKYRRGKEEHGGHLFEMDSIALLDEAINEAIDQVTYLVTLKQQLCKSHETSSGTEALPSVHDQGRDSSAPLSAQASS